MAWDPNSSSWDWDAEGVIVTTHLNGIDLRKPAASDWPNDDTELCPSKHDGTFTHTNRPSCSSREQTEATSQGVHMDVTRHEGLLTNRVVTPAMASMHSSLIFDGAAGHGNVVPMAQGRVPIVTTCIGGGAFTGCIDHGNGSLESVVRKGLHDNQGSGELTHPQVSKATSQHVSFAQEKQLNFAQDKQQSSSLQDKPCVVEANGRDHLPASKHMSTNKGIEGLCNGNGKTAAEEHSSTAIGSAGSGDSLTGLQLGKRTYSVDATTPAVAKPIPKLSSTSKKARASAAAIQIPRCQVEGCKLDLTSSKDYHRRHKVCEPHSKARKVIVASLEQRFCQQCSRYFQR